MNTHKADLQIISDVKMSPCKVWWDRVWVTGLWRNSSWI